MIFSQWYRFEVSGETNTCEVPLWLACIGCFQICFCRPDKVKERRRKRVTCCPFVAMQFIRCNGRPCIVPSALLAWSHAETHLGYFAEIWFEGRGVSELRVSEWDDRIWVGLFSKEFPVLEVLGREGITMPWWWNRKFKCRHRFGFDIDILTCFGGCLPNNPWPLDFVSRTNMSYCTEATFVGLDALLLMGCGDLSGKLGD